MRKKLRKYRQMWLVLPIVFCIGVIVFGGINYIFNLRTNLTGQAIENVLTVTRQQQQAFDNFISADRERLRSFKDFMIRSGYTDPEEIQPLLTMFDEADTVYSVICLDDGWFCSNTSEEVLELTQEQVAVYAALEGSGVRDTFVGIFSGIPRFSYYESFTFSNGHRGLTQKSYDRTKVSNTFSLSFYNDQGLAYVVNQRGDILLRGDTVQEDRYYDNIFDLLTGDRGEQSDIDRFSAALDSREPGSLLYKGERSDYVFAYVPMEAVDDWFLVSVVSMEAITAEANEILMSSRQALALLAALLVVCVVFGAAIWVINRSIRKRDNEIGYQAALINIFSTYLSRNTDNVFMLLDAETVRMDYTSPNIERVLGLSQEQMANNVYHFQPRHLTPEAAESDSSEEHLARLCKLEPGTEVEDIYLEWVNPKTQEQLWMLESAYCTEVQGRKKLVFYISDRTQERKAQNNLTEALRMAKAANEAKSAFLGSVSHDIRTPMNAIVGFITLLKDEADNPDVVLEYAGRIETASQHLLSLINDVLDINKIESGSTSLNLVEMNLAEVVDEINAIIRPQAKAKDQTFDIFVSPLKYELLQGDKLRINQILINLLSNAVKYTPAGGKIEMRVEELPQMMPKYSRIRFTVSDNGMGMSEEYLKVIFDPFTREQTEATYEIQGTGLGMAITKSLVDLMGGSIKVKSKLGEGSTFTVELGLRIQEREEDPQVRTDRGVKRMVEADGGRSKDDSADVVRGKHILVVDDIEVNRIILVKILSTLGAACDTAVNGQDAVDKFNASQPGEYDLILMDVQMPVLNGYGATRAIRAGEHPSAKTIPIIAMTANAFTDDVRDALESGMDAHIAKPVQVDALKSTIRQVLDSRLEQSGG